MMHRCCRMIALATLLTLSWAMRSDAGPPDFRRVPADSKWVAHFDADAFRSSPVLKTFVEHCLSEQKPGQSESLLLGAWPMSTLDKLDSVTAFGSRLALKNGAAILEERWDKDEIVRKLQSKRQIASSTQTGHATYAWTEHPGTEYAHEVAIAFPRTNVMVFASSNDLPEALALVDGKAAALGNSGSPLTADVPQGTVLLARGAGLTDADLGPHFRFFGHIAAFEYRLTDRNGAYEEVASLDADTEKAAEKLKKVVEGSIAWVSLRFGKDKELSDMIDATELTRNGKQVRVRFHASSSALAGKIPELCDSMRDHWRTRERILRMLLGGDDATGGAAVGTNR
jgi:hypothetical protein